MKTLLKMTKVLSILFIGISVLAQEEKSNLDLKLYAMDCGKIEVTDFTSFSDTGDYDNKTASLSDPCFVVRHSKGILLWDTGLSDHLIKNPQVIGPFKISKSVSLKDQLNKINLNVDNFNFVSVSHSHFDHTGNLNLFTKAKWILQKAEIQYAKANSSSVILDPTKMTNWKNVKKVLIDGDYDVFGDGSVVILKTPGHTPGHQALEINLAKSGVIILSGDEYHQRESFEPLRIPKFNTSRAETMASADRMKAILKNTNGRLIIQHDAADINSFPVYPEFMD